MIQGLMQLGFKVAKDGEAEADELNKILKDEKMEYLFQFLAVKLLKKQKVSIMSEADIELIAQMENVPKESVSVDYALSLYDKLSNSKKISLIREANPDENLKYSYSL